AMTADVADGVPADLTYAHRHGEFARVVQRVYANGPAGLRQTFFAVFAKDVFFLPSQDYDVRVPGRRVVLFQASPDVYYQQTVMPQATPFSDNLTQLILVRRYAEPGKTYVVPFARGPVGPGIERPRFYTTVSRHRGHLSAYLPLFSGADS